MAKGRRGTTSRPKKPKKEKNGESAPKQEAAPGPGHNLPELSDDQRFALTVLHKKSYERSLAAKKAADADLKNTCKLARAELGPTAIDDIKDMIALDSPEGESLLKSKVERMVKVARWMGLPIGTQGDIFSDVDRTPAVEKAEAKGKRDGLAGAPCNPECDTSVPQYESYMKGFHAGQAVLAKGIRPIEQAPDSEELDALEPSPEGTTESPPTAVH